jgi:hypothetical protein
VIEIVKDGFWAVPMVNVAPVTVPPGVVTATVPPAGTVAVIDVGETTVYDAEMPPNVTLVAPPKPLPVIVTFVPTGPLVGEKLVIEGFTLKGDVLVAVPLAVVTVTGPLIAAVGTVAVIVVDELTLKPALTPLKATAVAPLKPLPEIVTEVPVTPLVGLSPEMAGAPAGEYPSTQLDEALLHSRCT